MIKFKKTKSAINDLLKIMADLRSPQGCPWDREQDHQSLRFHAVEEVYELIDAIESGDDEEMLEELGDLLLQVVFHAQLAKERNAFDFEAVARQMTEKLLRRHPHVFGDSKARTVDQVWAQWDQIKKAEKHGTGRQRDSVFDGIPRHLPALLRAEKLSKKARKAKLPGGQQKQPLTKNEVAKKLFELAEYAAGRGWSPEELLRKEARKKEKLWRENELLQAKK